MIQPQETSPEGPASFCLMDPRGTIGADGCAVDPVRSPPATESLVMGEQRVGRCMCAKDSVVRKPIVKKRVEIQSSGSASGAVRGHSEPATAHIVPKVQVFTSSANCGPMTAPPAATPSSSRVPRARCVGQTARGRDRQSSRTRGPGC